jgi:hypothetical protein
LRAAVGLIATIADDAPSFPDKALELPMLAVSTALQISLRAQQQYAQLVARGDEVLNRVEPTDEPPSWASFDPPVAESEIAALHLAGPDEPGDAAAAGSGPANAPADTGDPAAPSEIADPADDPAAVSDVVDGTTLADAGARKRIRAPRSGPPSAFDAVEDE